MIRRNFLLAFTGILLAMVFLTPVKKYIFYKENAKLSVPDYSGYNRFVLDEGVFQAQLSAGKKLPYKELIIPQGRLVSPHTPCILELPNGDLFTVWSSTMPWGSRRILCSSRLPYGAKKWTSPVNIKGSPTMDHKNPVLFLNRDDKLCLLWTMQRNYSKWYHQDMMQVSVSDDLGRTWGEWHDFGMPTGYLSRTHPTKLHNGWLILPIYLDWCTSSAITISKDGGLSWSKPKWILPFFGIQPTIVQNSDLSLFALTRSGMWPQRSWQVMSKDLGNTWRNYGLSEINNPGSALEMIKLKNGHVVLVFNNSKEGRSNLSLALSYDGGKTWPHIKAIEDKPDHVYAYPSMVQTQDGLIHVVYAYEDHQNIAHFVTNEEWIKSAY